MAAPNKPSISQSVDGRQITKSLASEPEISHGDRSQELLEIDVSKILTTFSFSPGRKPLRHYYDQAAIEQWAENDLKLNGIRSPLWVRPHPTQDNVYELIAGQRRLKAAQYLDLRYVPARVFDWDNRQAFEAAMAENANREDFTALEEADHIFTILARELRINDPVEITTILNRHYNNLRGNIKQVGEDDVIRKEIVDRVFNSYGRITFATFYRTRLSLLKLPSDVLTTVRAGDLPFSTALEIVKVKDESERGKLLSDAVNQKLSLVDVKKYASKANQRPKATNTEISKRLNSIKKTLVGKQLSEDDSTKLEKLVKQIEKMLT